MRRRIIAAVAAGLIAPAVAAPALAQTPAGSGDRPSAGVPPRLVLRAEFRERMESAARIGYTPGRDDVFWLSRLRVTLTSRPVAWAVLTGQIQDARVADKDVGATGSPFSAPIDVRVAQVELRAPGSPVSVTVGRQELAFGEQRLVGHVSWANAARTFDAARLTLRGSGLQVDAFASSVVRIRTDDWDRGGFGNQFHGVHASSTGLLPNATLEPYVFWKRDRDLRTEAGRPGDLGLGTFGSRLTGRAPSQLEYAVEAAIQRGTLGTDTQRAHALHLRLRRSSAARGVRPVAEYNYASGDENPDDGRRGTFDPLYPTPHDKYGLADQVGWRNVHHVRAAADVSLVPQVPVTVAWHSWWLASRTDALYNAPGAAVARIPAGASSRHVGQGLDVQAARAFSPQLQAAAGYAWIHPGGFLRAATPGATYHAAYLMVTIAVAAER